MKQRRARRVKQLACGERRPVRLQQLPAKTMVRITKPALALAPLHGPRANQLSVSGIAEVYILLGCVSDSDHVARLLSNGDL